MAANGKINSGQCPNNWVRKLHGNINARSHFCISDYVAAAQVSEKCSFVNKWSLLCVNKLYKIKYMPNMMLVIVYFYTGDTKL